MADWSELLPEVLAHIAGKLSVADYIRFGSVCVSWASATVHKPPLPPQSPWLMLTPSYEEGRDTAAFYSLSEERIYRVRLPVPDICNRMWVGSSGGWLVTADDDCELHLLNPITRTQFQLPFILSLPTVPPNRDPGGRLIGYLMYFQITMEHDPEPIPRGEMSYYLLQKAVVSWTSRGWLVVLTFYPGPRIAFARAGDEAWVVLYPRPVYDIFLQGEQLYSIDLNESPSVGLVWPFPSDDNGRPTTASQVSPHVRILGGVAL